MQTNFLHPLRTGLLAALLALPAAVAQEGKPENVSTEQAGEFRPKKHDFSRYQDLAGTNPFEFEKPPEAPQVMENPFENCVLTGYAGSGATTTVFLLNTKTQERISIYGDASPRKKFDKSGIRVVQVNKARSRKDITVTLEKNGRTENVGFDEKMLQNMRGGPGGGPGAQPGQPGIQGPGGGPIMPDGTKVRVPRPNMGNMGNVQPQAAHFQPQQPIIIGGNSGGNVTVGAGTPQQPQTIQLPPGLPAGAPQNTTQQNINHLINQPNPTAIQPQQGVIVPGVNGAPPAPGTAPQSPTTPGARRRVVLPTPPQ